jgi:hypothetical protein
MGRLGKAASSWVISLVSGFLYRGKRAGGRRSDQPRRDHIPGRLDTLGRRPTRKVVVGAGLVAYSWLAGGTAPFTDRSLISVLVPEAVLGAIAYGRPTERIASPESIDLAGFLFWAIGVAVLLEWEAVGGTQRVQVLAPLADRAGQTS